MNKGLAILTASLAVLCGCGSDSGELSQDKDKEMRANFKRALADEELMQMQGGAPSQPRDTTKPPEGASGPPPNAPE